MRLNVLALFLIVIGLVLVQQGLDSLNPSREMFLSLTGTVLFFIGCAPIVLQIHRFQKRRKGTRLREEQ